MVLYLEELLHWAGETELISIEARSALMSPEGGALAESLEWGRR